MDPWLVDPRTKQGGPSRPALLFFGIARGVGPRAPASEPRADAHAHHHRVELGGAGLGAVEADIAVAVEVARVGRSEEHTSELQTLLRITYAVFCLKKKKQNYKIY